MRPISKSARPPAEYEKFVEDNPTAIWEFLSSTRELQDIKNQVKVVLYQDQMGLCAYCEIKMNLVNGSARDDFRIEHFHPKSDVSAGINWNLPWDNLLGVCCGGSEKYIAGEKRFTKPDFSCDVPKGDRILDSIIINPTCEISHDDKVFYFRSDGRMVVHSDCPTHLKGKASSSIVELRLSEVDGVRPPARRLDFLRREMISTVTDAVAREVEVVTAAGVSSDEEEIFKLALDAVAEKLIPDPTDPPSFLSALNQFIGR